MTMQRLTYFIVPCGAAKADHAAPANELYVGSAFTYAWQRVQAEVKEHEEAGLGEARVLILSALHGFVDPEQVLDPYNVKMGDKGSISIEALQGQAIERGLDADGIEVYAFLPKAYYAALNAALQPLYVYPQDVYEAAPGIGYQRGVLNNVGRPFPAVEVAA